MQVIFNNRGCFVLDNGEVTKDVRRYNYYTSTIGINCIHLRNPWVTAWWSAAFPGFGHIHLGLYFKGFLLFFWEIIINVTTKLNYAMMLSFTGQFQLAKDVLDLRLLFIYIPVYLYCIWDSYRLTVDLNKHYYLAEREKVSYVPFQMNSFSLNAFTKRNPWVALVWSLLYPGLGSLYIHRLASGFFAVSWTAVIIYFSHFLEAIQYVFLGDLSQATVMLNAEWFFFLPSVYCFSAYEAYILAVEYNKLYKKEQKKFLLEHYQHSDVLQEN